jgi:hypothetical protein
MPKISVIIRGEDLNPFMPQYQNIVELLAKANIQLPPAGPAPLLPPGQPGQPPQTGRPLPPGALPAGPIGHPLPVGPIGHPGMAPTADLVNRHQAEESGQPQGFGGLARKPS